MASGGGRPLPVPQPPKNAARHPVKCNRQGVDQMKRIVLGLLAATALCLPAFAADIKPALLYDLKCSGSQAYLQLASEVIRRERKLRAA